MLGSKWTSRQGCLVRTPVIRNDGFETSVARDLVVTWSASFESIRTSRRVDRFDSVYLGDFEPMEDTWVDPVGSNKATQDGFEHGSVMVSNVASAMGSKMAL